MAKELLKQDRSGSRRPADTERKYRLGIIEPTAEEVEELKNKIVVDDFLSTTSTHPVQNKIITQNLNNKVTKEAGKGLSTNDFTNEYIELINSASGSSHTHSNKTVLDGISQEDIDNWNSKIGSSLSSYNLESYKVSGLTILRSSCIEKDGRVCINFVGTLSMEANTTTTLFNLPSELYPTATKDFVVFGQSSNNDGYIGYGFITNAGLMQVRFNVAITSYIRFSLVYDLD